jgi:hypothetical protein
MKPHRIACTLLLSSIAIASCGPSQRVTSSWTSPDFRKGQRFQKVFITSFASNQRVRLSLEDDMAAAATAKGLAVVKGHDVFPSTFTKENAPDKEAMLAKIRELGCDLIFTTALMERRSETRYVPGVMYAPFPGYGYRFRGYYGYWWPMMYDPGYYTTDRTYAMEGNLFDARTDELIWSVQTESYNPESIERFSKGLTEVMMGQAMKDLGMAPRR